MRLSISNIAWAAEHDEEMYGYLEARGFAGLEIAPTRVFPDRPYERLGEARAFAERLYRGHGLRVCSMQSLWYGRTENLFGPPAEFAALLEHTRRAVDFAAAVGCGNLVFGSPRNRNVPEGAPDPAGTALRFFREAAEYAAGKGAVIAMEANPPVYGTNFINTTAEAFAFARAVGSEGLRVNLDLGTMIHNGEPVSLPEENIGLVSHVHLSEPNLAPLERRGLHRQILDLPFGGYFSIEIGNRGDPGLVRRQVDYVAGLAGGGD
ncbi:MAG: sugar phosphate isomerase/epimerase [Deltaproteobacteria bacterium]|jgi:sugar phosphate isomerase/epimerase|nr:sugar phosphate isomerase/epimerase [Deltaproteobacteria bacterium]